MIQSLKTVCYGGQCADDRGFLTEIRGIELARPSAGSDCFNSSAPCGFIVVEQSNEGTLASKGRRGSEANAGCGARYKCDSIFELSIRHAVPPSGA
jgi:hypothetical protein